MRFEAVVNIHVVLVFNGLNKSLMADFTYVWHPLSLGVLHLNVSLQPLFLSYPATLWTAGRCVLCFYVSLQSLRVFENSFATWLSALDLMSSVLPIDMRLDASLGEHFGAKRTHNSSRF